MKYIQSTNFTCGAASLMTALKYFFPEMKLEKRDEFVIWREGSTVYMGGCNAGVSAFGLALSAQARGLETVIYDSGHAELLLVRQHQSFKYENEIFLEMLCFDQQRYIASGAALHMTEVTQQLWHEYLSQGYIAIAMVQERDGPDLHWVLVFGIDQDGMVDMHDTYPYTGKVAEEASQPMTFQEFWQWTEMPPLGRRTVIFMKPKSAAPNHDVWTQLWCWWLWPFVQTK
jgi:hypothetical protein